MPDTENNHGTRSKLERLIMNTDTQNLKRFIKLFNSLECAEGIYDELSGCNLPRGTPDFFELYFDLIKNMEPCINMKNLSENSLEKYDDLTLKIYNQMMLDSARGYALANNIESIFFDAYVQANLAVKDFMEPYQNKKPPFFACGFTSLEVYIRPASFLGLLLLDKRFIALDYCKYESGTLSFNLNEERENYNLTGQEMEIFAAAYKAALNVLKDKLNLCGKIDAFLD